MGTPQDPPTMSPGLRVRPRRARLVETPTLTSQLHATAPHPPQRGGALRRTLIRTQIDPTREEESPVPEPLFWIVLTIMLIVGVDLIRSWWVDP
jgi:hypothetical protein